MAEFFNGLLKAHPAAPTSSTPIYSNAAFQVLAYALETLSGQAYPDLLIDKIIKPLGLTQSFYNKPSISLGVIPSNPSDSGWELPMGDETP